MCFLGLPGGQICQSISYFVARVKKNIIHILSILLRILELHLKYSHQMCQLQTQDDHYSLSMHVVLDFFVFNFDLEYIFIFAFLISKVRHHDGCGQVAASGEEGGNKPQPPSGETGRVHLQFANISLQKHLDGKPKITLGFFCRQSCWLSRSTLRTSRGSCWTRILASARSSTTPRTKTPWTGASSSFLQQQISS